MIKIETMPKETLAELVLFIAEHETFASVTKQLGASFTAPQVRAALRELGRELTREAVEASQDERHEIRRDTELSSKAKAVLTSLAPNEEHKLLSAFRLIAN